MDYLFVVGFLSILGQVVLLRELNVSFYGVELIYTLALGVWLLWTACGAMISRRTENPPFAKINLLFLLLTLVIPLDIAFIRSARLLFDAVPGAYMPFPAQMALVSAALLPAGLTLGLLFQWTAKAHVAGAKSLASAYAIESLGGLAGGISATLFLKFGFQNFTTGLFCAMLAAAVPFLRAEEKSARWLRPAAAILLAAMAILAWKARPVDRYMTAWTHPNLVETRDTPYSRISVASGNGQASVFENDALLFDTESTQAEEFVNLAALQHPNPQTVLVLGGGIDGTIREILRHSPLRVDYVELNSALVDAVRQYLPPDIQRSLRSSRVRVIYDDPRRFLDRAMKYDLILIGMPEPASGQANRFYTREFFRQCRAKLNDRGVIAFRLQSSENLWTPLLTRKMISIYRAAKSVFADVLFLPGNNSVVLGSTRPLARDPSIPASRLKERGIHARLVSAGYLRYLYTNDRFPEIARALESGAAPMNTDARPVCYRYAATVWLSKFYPSLKFRDFSFPELNGRRYGISLLALVLPFLLLRRFRWPVRRTLLAGLAGFAGMVLETILVLQFQTKNGILFQDIGVLLTGFMAGLAAGALATDRIKRPLPSGYGAGLVLGFAALSAMIGFGIRSGGDSGLLEIFCLLALAGLLVGSLFAFASLREAKDQKSLVAPMYSADLVGGCLGSILASLILAPVAGLALACYLMTPVMLLSALLL